MPDPVKLAEFTAWCQKHVTGDEKAQEQIFLDRLFQAFGQPGCLDVGGTTEFRVRKSHEDGGGAGAASPLVNKLLLPNGAYVTNLYDGLARLTNTALVNSGNATLDTIGYAYNVANQRTEQWRGAIATNTTLRTNDASYTYDQVGFAIYETLGEIPTWGFGSPGE